MSAVAVALMVSAGAFAQDQPHVHKMKADRSPEVMEARKMARKDSLAKMTPTERKAFKQANRQKREARLNAMTPEQRAKMEARRKEHSGQ